LANEYNISNIEVINLGSGLKNINSSTASPVPWRQPEDLKHIKIKHHEIYIYSKK